MSAAARNPSFMVQKQIRDNCKQVQGFMDDIYHWSETMAKEEKARDYLRKNPDATKQGGNKKRGASSESNASAGSSGAGGSAAPPPIRGRTVLPTAGEKKAGATGTTGSGAKSIAAGATTKSKADETGRDEEHLELARDTTSLPKYYKNWNKYDVDKECEKLEEDGKSAKPEFNVEEYVQQKRTTAARPNVKVAVRTATRATTAVEFSTAKKEEANRLFGKGRFKEAEAAYRVALTYLRGENAEEDELQVILYSNIAACNLKVSDYTAVVEACNAALKVRPDHVKSLFRRGTAYTHQANWRKAAPDLRKALELDPTDAKCRAELSYVDRMQRETLEKTRKHAKSVMQDSSRKPQLQMTPLVIKDKSELEMDAEKNRVGGSSASRASWDVSADSSSGATATSSSSSSTSRAAGNKGAGGGSLFISSHSGQDSTTDEHGRYIPKSVRMAKQLEREQQKQAEALSSSANGTISSGTAASATGSKQQQHRDVTRANFYAFERDWKREKHPLKRFQLLEKTEMFSDSFTTELLFEVCDVFHDVYSDFHNFCTASLGAQDGDDLSEFGFVLFDDFAHFVSRKGGIVEKLHAINRWPLLWQSLAVHERKKLVGILEGQRDEPPKKKADVAKNSCPAPAGNAAGGASWHAVNAEKDPDWMEVRPGSGKKGSGEKNGAMLQPPAPAKKVPKACDLDDMD